MRELVDLEAMSGVNRLSDSATLAFLSVTGVAWRVFRSGWRGGRGRWRKFGVVERGRLSCSVARVMACAAAATASAAPAQESL